MNLEEFQQPTQSKGHDCSWVIPDEVIFFFMLSLVPFQHIDCGRPAKEPLKDISNIILFLGGFPLLGSYFEILGCSHHRPIYSHSAASSHPIFKGAYDDPRLLQVPI